MLLNIEGHNIMTIFICLDDNNGILFNHRRQSRDKAVLKDMLDIAEGKVWMNAYSSKLFGRASDKVIVEDDLFGCAPKESCCFVEDISLKPHEDKLEVIIVYYWNRTYPADVYLDIDLNLGWEITHTKEFGGTSHEKITRKIYKHKKQ